MPSRKHLFACKMWKLQAWRDWEALQSFVELRSGGCVLLIITCTYPLDKLQSIMQGWTSPGSQITVTTKFWIMAPNFCGFSVWNLLHFTLPAPKILRWLPEFQKIPHPLVLRKVALGWNSSHFIESDFSLPWSTYTQPLVLFLSQINPVHTLPSWFFKIRYNLILPSIIRSSKTPLSLNFLTKTFYVFLGSPLRTACPAYHLLYNLVTV
jgi:hypothetical protein